MFRRVGVLGSPALLLTIGILLAAILTASVATSWAALVLRKEQRQLASVLKQRPEDAAELVETWQEEQRWQLVSLVGDFVVLVASGIALVLVMRSYAGTHRSLDQLKSLASDILASMEDGVVTTDSERCVTSLNRRASELLQLTPAAVGLPLDELGPVGETLGGFSQTVLATRQTQPDQELPLPGEHQPLHLRCDCHLLHDSRGEVVGTVLHVRDVTERLLIEDRMRRMERFIGLGSLAAGLHHEIKNPLSALSLHVQLLAEHLEGQTDRDIEDSLKVLKMEVVRISEVLESFRDFASVNRLNRQPTEVLSLVNRIVDLVRPHAARQNVTIQVVSDADKSYDAVVDSVRLEQVILNLVMNAIEELSRGGRLEIEVHRDARERIQIDLADNGRGIPEGIKDRVFDPYFTTKPTGSGMGLAVCDKIIRQHNGELQFETSSSGTVFHITLPAEETDG